MPIYGDSVLEVMIDNRQHSKVPAMVQTFIDVRTGKPIEQSELVGLILHNVFTDSCGRKVMVYKEPNNV